MNIVKSIIQSLFVSIIITAIICWYFDTSFDLQFCLILIVITSLLLIGYGVIALRMVLKKIREFKPHETIMLVSKDIEEPEDPEKYTIIMYATEDDNFGKIFPGLVRHKEVQNFDRRSKLVVTENLSLKPITE